MRTRTEHQKGAALIFLSWKTVDSGCGRGKDMRGFSSAFQRVVPNQEGRQNVAMQGQEEDAGKAESKEAEM